MAIFDSILDGISDLGSWVSDQVDDVGLSTGDLIKGGVRAYGILDKGNKEKAAYAQKWGSVEGNKQGVDGNNVKPGTADFGLKNYAADSGALESYWHGVLTRFVNPKDSAVSPR